jgi:hypothetical protein
VITRRNGKEIDSSPTLFQVMWLEKRPEGWTMGTMKLQPVALWPVEFPDRITIRRISSLNLLCNSPNGAWLDRADHAPRPLALRHPQRVATTSP